MMYEYFSTILLLNFISIVSIRQKIILLLFFFKYFFLNKLLLQQIYKQYFIKYLYSHI